MKGKFYGVGVGPGDPGLVTFRAAETICGCEVVAGPGKTREDCMSYRIASGALPKLAQKEYLPVPVPMVKDREVLIHAYAAGAGRIMEILDTGRSVAYLTLGDPTVYASDIYLYRIIRARGYEAEIISGVPSFCAAAAALGESLAERAEQIHIVPSAYEIDEALRLPGTRILMKAAGELPAVKRKLQERGLQARMVENCGMETQRIYESTQEIPEDAGYYSLIVIKDQAGSGQNEQDP